jgi:hypothetical protein
MMSYTWIFRIVGAVILVIGIAAVGYFAYTAGAAQGQTAAPVSAGTEKAEIARVPWGLHPFRGLFFLPGLLCLAPFFLCLFVFLPLRMIFGPRPIPPYAHWMHWRERWHECSEHMPVPPPVEEWHRRMHETKKKED